MEDNKVRSLKKGDIVSHLGSEEQEVIEEIIFDNIKGDLRAYDGDRVTINGLHWYISDLVIIKLGGESF